MLDKLRERFDKLSKGLKNIAESGNIEIGETPRELVWQMDKVKVYRYINEHPITYRTPILVSYALINRYHMMDLQKDRSLVRKLHSLGLEIYVLDTGYPTHGDKYLNLDDYINGFLGGAIDFVRKRHQLPSINLLGICQGGTFAVTYAALQPAKIKNLITLVTPIDFDTEEAMLFRWLRDIDVDTFVDGFRGLIPGQVADIGFQLAKPMLRLRKQKMLMDVMDNPEMLHNFIRMEKWNNDQPSLAGEMAREFIKCFFQENQLVKGKFKLAGKEVKLENIQMPVLTIYASEDHLVPPNTTKPLNQLIGSKDKTLYEFPGGHVGVFTGRRSQTELAPTLANWLKERDA